MVAPGMEPTFAVVRRWRCEATFCDPQWHCPKLWFCLCNVLWSYAPGCAGANKETPPPVCQRGSLGDDKQQSQEEEIDFTSQERILIRSIFWIARNRGAPYHLS
jgi:hypothetical protein